MEYVIAILLVTAAAFLLLHRKRNPDETEVSAAPRPAPTAQNPLALELRNRMESFLEQDLFSVVIQPVMDFRTNRISDGEVLSRLNHPERGVIFPDDFLPVVDELGLSPKFDRYIFRKCCAWLSRALTQEEQFDCLSCNFSRTTLSETGIVRDLLGIADSYALPHRKLGVEITEREQETDAQQLTENLKQLKAAGFRIILDDYGNGVTSENDLMNYPLDIVKIDRSLLLNTCVERGNAEFRALVARATQLGMEVVCEGIETEAQDHFARDTGCHYGQGILYFRPIAHNQVFEMMRGSSILEEDT